MSPIQPPRLALALMIAVPLAGCGDASPPPTTAAVAPAPVAISAAEALAPEVARLVAEGNAAFSASRFAAPAGDNALERYIAALQIDPANAGAREALVEVFPLGVAAAEKAIDAGDRGEAARIIALLQRASPDSLPVRALQDRMAGRTPAAPTPAVEPATPPAADGG